MSLGADGRFERCWRLAPGGSDKTRLMSAVVLCQVLAHNAKTVITHAAQSNVLVNNAKTAFVSAVDHILGALNGKVDHIRAALVRG